jgi:5-methylthioribose kinase
LIRQCPKSDWTIDVNVGDKHFRSIWLDSDGKPSELSISATEMSPAGLEIIQRRYLAQLLKKTAAHTGCEMLRRLMGIVSIFELNAISDDSQRAVAEKLGMVVARKLLLNEVGSIEQIVTFAREAIQQSTH